MKKMILLLALPLFTTTAFAQRQKKTTKQPQQKPVQVVETPSGSSDPDAIDPGVPEAPADAAKIYTSVEQMPEFPGGTSAMMRFISENIQYPAAAKQDGVQGKVYVQFVVDKTGKVGRATIKRDIGSGCGAEAIRVVNAMPLWQPGRMHGEPVNVYYTLPFNFKLHDEIPAEPQPVK